LRSVHKEVRGDPYRVRAGMNFKMPEDVYVRVYTELHHIDNNIGRLTVMSAEAEMRALFRLRVRRSTEFVDRVVSDD
jgi:hypothetical protein